MAKPNSPITYTLNGTSGADTVSFVGGHLLLDGSAQTIPVNATQLTLNGESGNDTIVTDTPYGNASQSVFYDGGAGIDTLDLSNVAQAVWVRLVYASSAHGKAGSYPGSIATNFTVEYMNTSGGDPNDPNALVSSAADLHQNIQNIENVIGTAFDDFLELSNYGGMADGGPGNDRVIGGAGNDHVFGGSGDDFLFGKGGDDVMTGGTGADKFEVLTLNGNDVITDFNIAEGDSLYIAWQSSTDVLPDANSWQATTWTNANGVVHQAITGSFTGGSVTLVDLTLADVSNVMAHTTDFHYLNG